MDDIPLDAVRNLPPDVATAEYLRRLLEVALWLKARIEEDDE